MKIFSNFNSQRATNASLSLLILIFILQGGCHPKSEISPPSLPSTPDSTPPHLEPPGTGSNDSGNPTQRKAACSTAGAWVDHAESEYVVNLEAVNGKFIVAECGGDDFGVVNANRTVAGEWEAFYLRPLDDGNYSIKSSHGRYLSAELGGGGELHANRNQRGPWETFQVQGQLSDGATIALKSFDGKHFVSARIDSEQGKVSSEAPALGPWEQIKVHLIHSPVKQRHGIVHGEGRSFVDDDGSFYPLGATLFWALRGWKFEQPRLKQNLEFLANHHYDYVRILGEVSWVGNEIDPDWSDYQKNLGEFLDFAYDRYGLRSEITLIGGGHEAQAMALAEKITSVVKSGREHKILDFEVANESYGRHITIDEMRKIGRYLRQNFPKHLVAISSGEGTNSYMTPTTDWRTDFVNVFMQLGSANLATIHMDRGFGDFGWRAIRQPWDWKDFPFPVSHNEPIGPRSSVAEEVDPVRLAMLRAVGIINGVSAFVLHNGSGVTGQIDLSRNRPANLWEVPGIDGIMKAVRDVDTLLPPRAGEGNHWNNGWPGAPFNVDGFWASGSDHGVNRNYTASTSDGWISTASGVKDYVVFTASRNSLVDVFDVLKGKVQEVELKANETFKLTPFSRDNYGFGAFIIVGHYR